MPRKSTAELSTLPVDSGDAPSLLVPGSHLPEPVVPVFNEIVASAARGHFFPVDRLLLEQLSVAVFICRELAEAVARDGVIIDGKPNQAGRHLRQQQATVASLSTKLRLTTQSRVTKRGAASAARTADLSAADIYENATRGC